MAMMVLLMAEHSNEDIDVLRTLSMVLVHDLVEIYAGDTYAYDTTGNESKRERELEAAERLFNSLAEDQAKYFRGLWDEFEECVTPEAKFARTTDRIQPLMLNNASGGRSWKEHGVAASMVYGRNKNTAEGSETIWEYADNNFIKPNIEKGTLQ
jgi:putative hydrolase of HD superfamily